MIKIKNLLKEDIEYKIYCDLDSVLTDFDAGFREISDVPVSTGWDYKKKFGKQRFWDLVGDKGLDFWANLPWMSDGKKLWRYLRDCPYEVSILSAPSIRDRAISEKGKILWCRNHLNREIPIILEDEKYKYSGYKRILIDDLEKNIIPWRERGGIGILHTSANDTIHKLKQLGIELN